MGYCVTTIKAKFEIKKKNMKKAYVALCKLDENMGTTYAETCKTTQEILIELGFYVTVNSKGDITEIVYGDDSGQELYFLEALSPYVEEGSFIEWRGENGECYKNIFENKEMITKNGTIVYI